MRPEIENEDAQDKQMDEMDPGEEEKRGETKGAEKDAKGQSAEPDIQSFM